MKIKYSLSIIGLLALAGCAEQKSENFNTSESEISGIVKGIPQTNRLGLASTIYLRKEDGGFCSGVYVGENTVLTAGHCVLSDEGIQNQFDSAFAYNNPDVTADSTRLILNCSVSKVYRNSGYNTESAKNWLWNNDIAVVSLDFSCNTKNLIPFRLPQRGENRLTTVSGYGYGSLNEGPGMKSYLKTLDVSKLKKFETVSDFSDLVIATNLKDPRKERFTTHDWIKAMSQMASAKEKICFKANEGTSPVNGDSGGPGYFVDSNGDYVVTGVFSSFYYDDNKVVRGFCYNSVVNHLDWINSVMEDIRQRKANY